MSTGGGVNAVSASL